MTVYSYDWGREWLLSSYMLSSSYQPPTTSCDFRFRPLFTSPMIKRI